MGDHDSLSSVEENFSSEDKSESVYGNFIWKY